MKPLSKFGTFEDMLRFYGVQNMEGTLIDNGVDSLKLTKLIDEAKNQFNIPIDFVMAQTTPCSCLETQAANSSQKLKIPELPEFTHTDQKMSYFIPVQVLSIISFICILAFCFIPGAYAFQLAAQSLAGLNLSPLQFQIVQPFLLFVGPLAATIAFSIVAIVIKWTVIGRYKKMTTALWSYKYWQ